MTAPTDRAAALKPCPFCGGPAVVDHLVDDNDYFVHCRDCEVQQIANHSHEAAIELWNNRTHVQSLIDEAVKKYRDDALAYRKAVMECFPMDSKWTHVASASDVYTIKQAADEAVERCAGVIEAADAMRSWTSCRVDPGKISPRADCTCGACDFVRRYDLARAEVGRIIRPVPHNLPASEETPYGDGYGGDD